MSDGFFRGHDAGESFPDERPKQRRATRPRVRVTAPGRRVPASLEHWTGFALMAVADSAERYYVRALEKVPLTLPEFLVMAVIARDDGIAATDICDAIGMSKQQASRILSRFERVGYVGRSLKMLDFRYKGVWFTDAGRDTFEAARNEINTAERQVLRDVAVERQVALRSLLLGLVPLEETGWERIRRYLR